MNCYVMCFIRQEEKILLVQETSNHDFKWFFPAGKVDADDKDILAAAIRETSEEAGIEVKLDGIMRIDYRMNDGHMWMRILFAAHQTNDAPPKSKPNQHSTCARWVTMNELKKLELRSNDIQEICEHFSDLKIYPLEILHQIKSK